MVSLFHRWRYRDFTRMGRGIESRYGRCAEWWQPHITCTKTFVVSHLRPSQHGAVLGAGRLYDIDLMRLLECIEVVHLFDLDATCVPYWRRLAGRHFGKRVIPHFVDVTVCMDAWQAGIGKARRAGELSEYLHSLSAPQPEWVDQSFDTVISLNILGQIPLYWRDRVLRSVGAVSDDERVALEHSMGVLQEAHMNALLAKSERDVLLLADSEYYYYRNTECEWRVESALWGEARESYQRFVESRTWTNHETWMWHLVPQFIEARHEGEIHRVEAFYVAAS